MSVLEDKTYVDKAETAITNVLDDQSGKKLTTSKIRNLLSLTSNLYDEAQVKNFDDLADKLAYLRVQFVYQSGREMSVKSLVNNAQILEALKEVNDSKSLIRFTRYMEALVAYFKYLGGKD
jgi:CRISPR-associated protein Csm2